MSPPYTHDDLERIAGDIARGYNDEVTDFMRGRAGSRPSATELEFCAVRVKPTAELIAALAQSITYLENVARNARDMQLYQREADLRGHVFELTMLELKLRRADVLRLAGGGI